MSKQVVLSIQQREKGLIDLIADAKEFGFNKGLIEGYEAQLFEVQKELKKDSDKKAQFKLNIIERGES